jgi:RND family efflux transporter MFP subunit
MLAGKKVGTLVILAAIAAFVAVEWPGTIEKYFPGWTQRTQPVRVLLPGGDKAATAPARSQQAAEAPRGSGQAAPQGRGGGGGAAVAVDVDTAQQGPMPARIDAVGTVQPIATVTVKTRVDSQIDKIFVADGVSVKAGDMLVKLDSRQIEAQIKQTEATIAKDLAAIEQAERDVSRFQDLVSKGAGTPLNFENAKTTLASVKATLQGDQALLENQKIQLSWYTLTAPITGRVGTFSAKAGNIVRAGDNSSTGTLTTILQTSPIYVTFSVPQTALFDLRAAMDRGSAQAFATPQGSDKAESGKVAVLDNTIDPATGTIAIRAIFENAKEILWPGQLCNVRVIVRVDPDVVSVPRTATQSGQKGNFVFVVENGVAKVRAVKVGRTQDNRDIILEGLKGGETVVVDGAQLLIDGSRVDIRNGQSKKGAS